MGNLGRMHPSLHPPIQNIKHCLCHLSMTLTLAKSGCLHQCSSHMLLLCKYLWVLCMFSWHQHRVEEKAVKAFICISANWLRILWGRSIKWRKKVKSSQIIELSTWIWGPRDCCWFLSTAHERNGHPTPQSVRKSHMENIYVRALICLLDQWQHKKPQVPLANCKYEWLFFSSELFVLKTQAELSSVMFCRLGPPCLG
jgi:hypothetical protein